VQVPTQQTLFKDELPYLDSMAGMTQFLAAGLKCSQRGMHLDSSLRISKAVHTQLTLKIQQTQGYSHYEERDWTVWSFEDFYKFNTSGRGSLGFKDPDPKERIEKIPCASP